MSESEARRTIEAVWRIEAATVIAALARLVRDVGLAEDLAQEALLVALEKWPATGVPDRPAAWLTATAKNRALDLLRRGRMLATKHGEIARELARHESESGSALELALVQQIDAPVADDRLRLFFVACHPLLSPEARGALVLKVVAGLTTAEIARAFLVPEATAAQRIVRAKRSLAEARVPFEFPRAEELERRLASVCEAVYLLFNEGYSASHGESWTRADLCHEALRLARMLSVQAPGQSEVVGLAALLELQSSRLAARSGPDGEPVLLDAQDRSRWDALLIRRGLAGVERARRLARERGEPLGPYALQAEIAACHARARTTAETDWTRIAALYDALVEATGSPVVELNRAVAVGRAFGPAAGLEIADALLDEPRLARYHLLPAVRADLLERLGRLDEALAEVERAASLAGNESERRLLANRSRRLAAALESTQ